MANAGKLITSQKYNMNIRLLYSLFEKVNNSLNAQMLKQRLAQTSIKE